MMNKEKLKMRKKKRMTIDAGEQENKKKQPNVSGPLTKRDRHASGCSVHGGGGAMLCYQEPGPGGLVPVCLGLAQTQPPDPSIYIIARHRGRPGRGLIV